MVMMPHGDHHLGALHWHAFITLSHSHLASISNLTTGSQKSRIKGSGIAAMVIYLSTGSPQIMIVIEPIHHTIVTMMVINQLAQISIYHMTDSVLQLFFAEIIK
uniref:Uncharacterized protein n=1 Tax=Micrurus surinamensis TaxID=129470 RepID=A0A2D4PH87_MICSU